jgi:N-ethylmaleimide reductase
MAEDICVLFSPFQLAAIELANRFVMPAMTRCRAPASGVPGRLMLDYYVQRASAGLIIGEGTWTMPGGMGMPGIPGIYTKDQVAGWRRVCDAVHAAGGRFFLQLWHTGRVSCAAWQPDGGPPLGPSAVRAEGARSRLPDGTGVEPDMPREATRTEIAGLIEGFAQAAVKAIAAGCDGVELHAANGYLLHQFLSGNANRRSDDYGGSPGRRCRFAVEVAQAVVEAIGAGRVGMRISPLAANQGAPISDPEEVFPLLLGELRRLGIAYVHCIEGEPAGAHSGSVPTPGRFDFKRARRLFPGCWIANNFYDAQRAVRAIEAGDTDLIAFGRPFICNPDLVARVQRCVALNELDTATLYTAGAAGYTDYPTHEAWNRGGDRS